MASQIDFFNEMKQTRRQLKFCCTRGFARATLCCFLLGQSDAADRERSDGGYGATEHVYILKKLWLNEFIHIAEPNGNSAVFRL